MIKLNGEYCPRCSAPLQVAHNDTEDDRLCDTCGWFGDKFEVLDRPPPPEEFNPVLATAQVLELYRTVCRNELLVEQLFDAGLETEANLKAAVKYRRLSVNQLIEMFTAMRMVPKITLSSANGLIPWPEQWTDYHYNASKEPCDMLVGPCSCGAWHKADENWVQEVLKAHHAEIAEG